MLKHDHENCINHVVTTGRCCSARLDILAENKCVNCEHLTYMLNINMSSTCHIDKLTTSPHYANIFSTICICSCSLVVQKLQYTELLVKTRGIYWLEFFVYISNSSHHLMIFYGLMIFFLTVTY